MRINKYIAENSSFSRRKADELVIEGKVFINGKKAKLGDTVTPGEDTVRVGNTELGRKKNFLYLALHKPKGYISTRDDELNRPTVLDLVPQNQNLKPVGRLDKDTEGLLLLSNDGEFINQLTHPRYECDKEYLAIVKGSPSKEEIETLSTGIQIDGQKTSPADIKVENSSDKKTTLRITIHEGRKRQIRKMFASINHDVKYLKRLRIGTIKLGSLAVGKFRPLTQSEINAHKSS